MARIETACSVEIPTLEGEVSGCRVRLGAELAAALDLTIWRIAVGLLFNADPEWDSTSHSLDVVQADEENPAPLPNVLSRI